MIDRSLKILAIDDNIDNLITIKAVLSEILPNSMVLTASGGALGIDAARNFDPDVILLDIIMPGIDGYETCKLLKSDDSLRIIPVLFMTALKTNRDVRMKAIDAGAEGFLSKPIDEIDLMAQIKSMAKIKEANELAQLKADRLEELVNKRTLEIQKELRRRMDAEKELVKLNEDLLKAHNEKLYIIDFQKKLLELKLSKSIYQLIAKVVYEFVGDGYVVTSNYDEESNAMNIENYIGFGNNIDRVIKVLGFDPRKTKFYISDMIDDELKIFKSGLLEKLDNGLYKLLVRKVPLSVSKILERILNINNIYTMGFVLENLQYGGISILAKNDIQDKLETIQILINQAVLALHRTKAEESLRASEEKYKTIFDQAPLGIALTESDSRYLFSANKKFEEITGWPLSEKDGIDWTCITHPDDIDIDLKETEKMKKCESMGFNMNKRYIKPDGSTVWVNMTIAPIRVKAMKDIHLCMIEDITEKKERQKRIEYLSYHDTLTGLYNRAYYEESVARLNHESYLPLSLIVGDINGLKLINDSLGHADGDKIIAKVGDRLKCCVREKDILARIGGDEFSILMPNTTEEEADSLLDFIYNHFKNPINELGLDVDFLSISLGFATKKTIDQSFSSIEKLAEDYMYKRKLLEHKSFHSTLLTSMKTTLYEKSNETLEHANRLMTYARKLGEILNFREEQYNELELLSAIHDIGKIGINDSVLKKPGKLTDLEWLEMKKHPEIGYRIAMTSPGLESIAECILYHHEKWDGTGYPQGLKGEEIPLLSRILGIVDAFDAMTNDRAYRNAMTVYAALEEIEKNAGTQFDPNLSILFLKIIKSDLLIQKKLNNSIIYVE